MSSLLELLKRRKLIELNRLGGARPRFGRAHTQLGHGSVDCAGYLETLRSVNSRWKILVVDQHTQQMLLSVLTTYEILDEGVQRQSSTHPRPRLHHPSQKLRADLLFLFCFRD